MHSQLDVDLLCEKLETCLNLQQVTPCRKRASSMGSIHVHISLVDHSCKKALVCKNAVWDEPISTDEQKTVAIKTYRSCTDRVKEAWERKRNPEPCELAAKHPSQFWKAFKTIILCSCRLCKGRHKCRLTLSTL